MESARRTGNDTARDNSRKHTSRILAPQDIKRLALWYARRYRIPEQNTEDATQNFAAGVLEAQARLDESMNDKQARSYQCRYGRGYMLESIKFRMKSVEREISFESIRYEDGTVKEFASDGPPPCDGTDRADTMKRLLELIDELPEREAFIIRAVHVAGWYRKQAAREIGLSAERVSQLERQALAKLRKWCTEREILPDSA